MGCTISFKISRAELLSRAYKKSLIITLIARYKFEWFGGEGGLQLCDTLWLFFVEIAMFIFQKGKTAEFVSSNVL